MYISIWSAVESEYRQLVHGIVCIFGMKLKINKGQYY